MFDSVATAVETLASEYTHHPDTEPAFDLRSFFEDALDDVSTSKTVGRTRAKLFRKRVERIDALSDATPLDIEFEKMRARAIEVANDSSLNGTERAAYLAYCDDLLAFAALATDLCKRYQDPPIEKVVIALEDSINAAVSGDLVAGHEDLAKAGTELYTIAVVARRADQLRRRILSLAEPKFGTSAEDLIQTLERAVANSEAKLINDVAKQVAKLADGTWSREDLFACSHREFEVLIADLWREGGYDARPTKYVQDYNIDVIVSTPSGTDLIQAKQFRPDNKVGVSTVQRTAGLIVEFDADSVYVVTSSSFTSNAKTSAERMTEDVSLIDGDQLCSLLTKSQLAPPL